jgi:hypothetical protein
MNIYIILFIIIIITIIYYKINNIIENFNECDYSIGSPCQTDEYYGIYNDECNCIRYNISLDSSDSSDSLYSLGSLRSSVNSLQNSNQISNTKEEDEEENEEEIDTNCINSQNFDKYCKNINSNYGVKKINKCKNNKYKVECDDNYIGGHHYENNNVVTPCLDNNLDFDSLCRYYNHKSIPNGYDINALGAYKILPGKFGDCFLNDGNSDPNKSRAICDYNHYKTMKKLNRSVFDKEHNIFTDCLPTNTDFLSECKNLMYKDIDKTKAIEISGYDCLPGYMRSKCTTSTKSNYNNIDIANTCNLYKNVFN